MRTIRWSAKINVTKIALNGYFLFHRLSVVDCWKFYEFLDENYILIITCLLFHLIFLPLPPPLLCLKQIPYDRTVILYETLVMKWTTQATFLKIFFLSPDVGKIFLWIMYQLYSIGLYISSKDRCLDDIKRRCHIILPSAASKGKLKLLKEYIHKCLIPKGNKIFKSNILMTGKDFQVDTLQATPSPYIRNTCFF